MRMMDMNAIKWMDARVKVVSIDVITVNPEDADYPEEVGTWEVKLEVFSGVLPYHMRKEAFKLAAQITQASDLHVKVQGYDKTDVVEYFKTTTRRLA